MSKVDDFYDIPAHAAPGVFGPLRELVRVANVPCWVAGGALRDAMRGEPSRDIDLFFASSSDVLTARNNIVAGRPYEVLLDCDSVHRISLDGVVYDFIKHAYGRPLTTLWAFDFTAVCAAIGATHFAYHVDFAIDAMAKRLRINELKFPHSTLRRVEKFTPRGWEIDAETLGEIQRACASQIEGDEYYNPWSETKEDVDDDEPSPGKAVQE